MKDAITNCGTSQNYGWKNEFHHLGITFLFPENKVNTMTADALTPSVARTSAAMASTVYDKSLLVFHGEAFPLHAPSQYRGMIENGNLFLCWQFSITKHTAKYNPHRLYHWKYFFTINCYGGYEKLSTILKGLSLVGSNGPLTRYVKLRVAHAPGLPGTFFPPTTLKETAS